MSPEVVCKHIITQESSVSLASVEFNRLEDNHFLIAIHQLISPEYSLFNDLQTQQLIQIISRLCIIKEGGEETRRITYLTKLLEKLLTETETAHLESLITDRNLPEYIWLINEISLCYAKTSNACTKQYCEDLIPKILFTLLDKLKTVRSDYSDYKIDKLIDIYKAINSFGKVYFDSFLESISYYINHTCKISCIISKILNSGIEALNKAILMYLPSTYMKIQSYSELRSLCKIESVKAHIRDNITAVMSGKKPFLSIDESMSICSLLNIDESSKDAYKAIKAVTDKLPDECSAKPEPERGLYACALTW